MSSPVHFEVEILFDTTFTTACGVTPTIKNATTDDAQVTCRKCLAEMGYDVLATVVPFTPMSIDLDDDGGRVAA